MIFILILIVVIAVAALNAAVVLTTRSQIVTAQEAAAHFEASAESKGKGEGADCILVLGASVKNGQPSQILAYRLDAGIDVYGAGGSKLFLLSGDNKVREYNEVKGMESYVLTEGGTAGITDANIYLDYAGFSTYDSLKRAKDVFGAKRVIIVTQRYHLYRALYIANRLGLDAVGVAAEDRAKDQWYRDLREIPARVKDVFMCMAGAEPSLSGDPVPLIFPSDQEKP